MVALTNNYSNRPPRPNRICFSFAANADILIHRFKSSNIIVSDGLSDADLSQLESKFNIAFPLDLRTILHHGLPISSGFPKWRSSFDQQFQILLSLLHHPSGLKNQILASVNASPSSSLRQNGKGAFDDKPFISDGLTDLSGNVVAAMVPRGLLSAPFFITSAPPLHLHPQQLATDLIWMPPPGGRRRRFYGIEAGKEGVLEVRMSSIKERYGFSEFKRLAISMSREERPSGCWVSFLFWNK
ncbi:hypothetical protein PIB30_072677 [Stylosanthes scabra]|uniref:Uncharacterized protein n=1 Tax=Stylosanthes scabra TaxID=79078 RepID=A0ABU6VQ33_9FABA|nr:hypothetical protein [Stylosanthes scabra]